MATGEPTIRCIRCGEWVAVRNLVVHPYTGLAHCPACSTPLAPAANIYAATGVNPTGQHTGFDYTLSTWPEGAAGESLRSLQESGELVVVDLGLQAVPRYGICILHGGGARDAPKQHGR